jgi:hypothetical protein
MTAEITTLYNPPAMRRDVVEAAMELDVALSEAVDEALEKQVPLLLIVGMLQARMHFCTVMVLTDDNDDEE